jgi:membrane protease YdiL (CAAX protease family)
MNKNMSDQALYTWGQAIDPSNHLVQLMRRYPLVFYFLIAFGFSWAYELTVYRALHNPVYSLWQALVDLGWCLGPTLAAFLMTAVMQGRVGIQQLLGRYVLWRVGLPWYLLALLGVPALLVLAVLPLPGALSAFRLPALSFWPTYLMWYLVYLIGGPLGEEGGWRGFALPRLQQRSGPLVGTVLLGVLWGLWHLPFFFIPGTDWYGISFGTGFVGHLIGLGVFDIGTIVLAVIFTWVFNNTHGSLLLAILLHASSNATTGVLPPEFFPSLAGNTLIFTSWFLAWVVVALLIIVATRGRLSYQRYLRETARPWPGTDREQVKGEVRTSV